MLTFFVNGVLTPKSSVSICLCVSKACVCISLPCQALLLQGGACTCRPCTCVAPVSLIQAGPVTRCSAAGPLVVPGSHTAISVGVLLCFKLCYVNMCQVLFAMHGCINRCDKPCCACESLEGPTASACARQARPRCPSGHRHQLLLCGSGRPCLGRLCPVTRTTVVLYPRPMPGAL